jgi:hypothetical protein
MNSEAERPPPRFGPVPPGSHPPPNPPGPLPDTPESDLSRIPEFVSVLGADGEVAGYVRREDLFPTRGTDAPRSPRDAVAGSGRPRSMAVYDRNANVIGQWLEGVGFVPN